jgi:hypothetical protein
VYLNRGVLGKPKVREEREGRKEETGRRRQEGGDRKEERGDRREEVVGGEFGTEGTTILRGAGGARTFLARRSLSEAGRAF